jgi:hydrogenase maturation protease
VLVIAVGNPSRGDDAIGPALAARLEAAALPGVEVIVDYQLQPEHALDLEGRRLAIFVDAALDAAAPCELREVVARRDQSHTSHALSPEAVLDTFVRVTGRAPPSACCLAVRGERFGLGEDLSAAAAGNLEEAWTRLLALLRVRFNARSRPA